MGAKATKINALLQLARSGPLRARDLDREGIPRAYLRRLCDQGLLVRVDRGLYRLADAEFTEHHTLAEVAVRIPHATICLLSALQFHGLTTQMPHSVWIMVDRHAHAPKVTYPPLEIVWASGRALTHGVETARIEGAMVQITTPAKTVADCFKYRQRVGLEVALDALRDYLRGKHGTIEAMMEAARADRVYTLMRPYVEAMV